MQFSNYTPFSPLVFSSEDVDRRLHHVIVLRGTFAIEPDRPLRPLVEQEPVVLTDRYRGEIGRSSLVLESDLAPFKPRTDITIEATAYAPGGRPQPSWLVRAQVGRLERILRVTGPRRFRHGSEGWLLDEPEPCLGVPLTYELAFGGAQRVDDVEHVDERNPVGRGWIARRVRPRAGRAPRTADRGARRTD